MAFPASPSVGQQYTTPGGTTYEYSADGAWRIATAASGATSVLTDNGNGTFTHDDGTGNSVTFDLPAQVVTHISAAEAASIIDTGWDGIGDATAANISGLSGDETVLVEMDSGNIRQFQLSDLPIGGTSDASPTVKGVVEIASINETRNGTALGGTGAELAMNPERFFNLPNQGAAVDGAADRLLIKDDSAGQVRWVLVGDLPSAGGTDADYAFIGTPGYGAWHYNNGAISTDGESFPYTVPNTGVMQVTARRNSRSSDGTQFDTNTSEFWFAVSAGDVISINQSGVGLNAQLQINGTTAVTVVTNQGFGSVSSSGNLTSLFGYDDFSLANAITFPTNPGNSQELGDLIMRIFKAV